MGALLRKLAALAVLTALCELLLPENGLRSAVRLVLGAVTVTVALGAFAALLPKAPSVESAVLSAAQEAEQRFDAAHEASALQAFAAQLGNACERMAKNAGYACEAQVALQSGGTIDRVTLRLDEAEAVIPKEELLSQIAEALAVSRDRLAEGSP